jgi:hypothetical protein
MSETWQLLANIVTVVGLPLAIFIFAYEQRKERDNEESEVFQSLSDNYQEFLRTALEHPDLRLFSADLTPELTPEQRERMLILFNMLVSLFERAYLLLYEESMTRAQERRWMSWEDYMREWSRRADFVEVLPELLRGEDPEFAAYLNRVVHEEVARLKIKFAG